MAKEYTKAQQYKRNQKKAKLIRAVAPVVFWVCLFVGLLCIALAIRNSFGNIAEITELLDKNKYNSEEIADNYDLLVEKYGEWEIGFSRGGVNLTFIDIKQALFGGFAVMNAVMGGVFILSAFLLGKWLLLLLAKSLEQENQDLVNYTILQDK